MIITKKLPAGENPASLMHPPLADVLMGEEKPEEELMGKRKSSPCCDIVFYRRVTPSVTVARKKYTCYIKKCRQDIFV